MSKKIISNLVKGTIIISILIICLKFLDIGAAASDVGQQPNNENAPLQMERDTPASRAADTEHVYKEISRSYSFPRLDSSVWTGRTLEGNSTNSLGKRVEQVYLKYWYWYNDNSVVSGFKLDADDQDGTIVMHSTYPRYYNYGGNHIPVWIGDNSNPVTFTADANGQMPRKIVFSDTVRYITRNAFKGNPYIEEIDLRKSPITYIGESAFEGCTNLKRVLLPDTVVEIDKSAFKGCTQLISDMNETEYHRGLINIDNVYYIAKNAFEDCHMFRYVTLCSTLQTLGDEAFKNCNKIENVTIPNTLTYFGYNSFFGCTTLADATIECDFLGVAAFEDCVSITNVMLCDDITYIPEKCFRNGKCMNLHLPEKLEEIGAYAFQQAQMQRLSMPNATRIINEYAFNGCANLVEFDLNQVQVIGQHAFSECSKLPTITIPESVTAIEPYAFAECSALATVQMNTEAIGTDIQLLSDGSDHKSGEYMFYNCPMLQDVIYSKLALITITPTGMFCGATRFKDTDLLNSPDMVEIQEKAYYNSGFETVLIPSNIVTVGKEAFAGCTSLLKAEVHSQMMSERMFYGSTLTDITIGGEPTTIGDYACASTPLTNVTLVDGSTGLTTLGNYMFADCVALEHITLPSSLAEDKIGTYVFSSCTGLKEVILNCTALGEYMFENCSSLISIDLAHIEILADYAFSNSYIQTVIIGPNVTTVGVGVFEFSQLKNLTIQNAIIGERMFKGCQQLETVTVPSSVKEVRVSAFEDCINLKEVKHQSSKIGEKMYKGCTNITSITIPASTDSIGDYAFQNCTKLKTINYNTMHGYSNHMFDGCTSLEIVTVGYNVNSEEIGTHVFANCTSLHTINYYNKKITAYMFANCTSLQHMNFMNDVESYYLEEIENNAFEGCITLGSFSLGDATSLRKIGNETFKNCTVLTNVVIPNSVEWIGASIFYGCEGLQSVNIPFIGSSKSSFVYDATTMKKIDGKVYYKDGSHLFGYLFGNGWENGIEITQSFSPDKADKVNYTIPKHLGVVRLGKEDFIPYGAFSYFSSVEDITLPTSTTFTKIADCAFMYSGLTSITIPFSVTDLGTGMFEGCASLVSCFVGSRPDSDSNYYTSWTTIPKDTFKGCSSLKNFMPSHLSLNADTEAEQGLYILKNISSLGEYAFYGCRSVPRAYLNTSITAIPAHCFEGCQTMTLFRDELSNKTSGIYIPAQITSIGEYAFSDCDGFPTLVVPATVQSLGKGAFSYSDGYLDATLNNDSLPDWLFAYCSNLVTVKINDAITTIGASAFENDRVFENLIYNDDETGLHLSAITSIGARAFFMNVSVTYFNFGENLTTIGDYAFYGMHQFEEIVVPENVRNIGEGVFGGWASLTTITLPYVGKQNGKTNESVENVFAWIFGRTFYKSILGEDESTVISAIDAMEADKTYIRYAWSNYANFYVPTTIRTVNITAATTLPHFAFYNIYFMTELNLPTNEKNTLKTLYRYCIAYCQGLTSITVPDSVTSIWDSAFIGSNSLEEMHLPFAGTSRTSTGHGGQFGYIFYDRDNVRNVGKQARYIWQYHAWAYIPLSLKRVYLTSPTQLASWSFYRCVDIEELHIANTLTTCMEGALRDMRSLKVLETPFVGKQRGVTGSFESLLGYAFGVGNDSNYYTGSSYMAPLMTNYIPATRQYFNETTYKDCYIPKTLTTLIINDENVLGYGSIMNCNSLTSITLNEGLEIIHNRAFEADSGLTNLTIPTTVTSIKENILNKCSGLVSLSVPYIGHIKDNHTGEDNEFGRWFGYEPYDNSIQVEGFSGQTYYITASLEHISLTNLEYLNDYAFYNCSFLKKVDFLSDILTTLGNYNFYGCTGLTKIEIPASVKTLNTHIFEGCTGLEEVTNYVGVERLGDFMFKDCTSLGNFDFKDNILEIGNNTFENCTKLGTTEILYPIIINGEEIPATPTPNYTSTINLNKVHAIGDEAFKGCSGIVELTLLDVLDTIGSYSFENCTGLTTLHHENTILGVGIFKGCTSLNNVVVNEGTTEICDEAFSGCSALSDIILASTTKSIGKQAFMDCISLLEIDLVEGIEFIGEQAFKGSGLIYVIIPTTVTAYGDYVFEGSKSLKKATFNNSILGLGIFKDCTDLRNVFIKMGITVIPEQAFINCEKLHLVTNLENYSSIASARNDSYSTDVKVELSESTMTYGISSFENCVSIDNVSFDHIKFAEKRAFFNSGVTHLEIPAGVSFGEELFMSCQELLQFSIFTTDLSVRIFMDCPKLDNVSLVEGTTIVPKQAFKDCIGLTNLVLPYSIREFHKECFMNTNIPSIVINPDMTVIEENVFKDCKNLQTVINYPDFIGVGMFDGCSSLITVWLFDQLTEIADRAFKDCSSLDTVSFMNTRPDFSITLDDKPYQNDDDWTWWVKYPDGVKRSTGVSTISDLGYSYSIVDGKWTINGVDTNIDASVSTGGKPTENADYYWHIGDVKTSVLTIQKILNQSVTIDENRDWVINGTSTGISAYKRTAVNALTRGDDFYYYLGNSRTNEMWIVPSNVLPTRSSNGKWIIDGIETSYDSRTLNNPATHSDNTVSMQVANGRQFPADATLSWETYKDTTTTLVPDEENPGQTKPEIKVVEYFKLCVTYADSTTDEFETNVVVQRDASDDTIITNTPSITTKTYWVVYEDDGAGNEVRKETTYEYHASDVWSVVNNHLAINGVETIYVPTYTELMNTPTINTSDYYWYIDGVKTEYKAYTEKNDDAQKLEINNWNWYLNDIDTGIDAYERTTVEPTLKEITSGMTVATDDLYWYIDGVKTSVAGYENANLPVAVAQDGTDFYWTIGGEKTVKFENPYVNTQDKYWYVSALNGEDINTNIWSVERLDPVVYIGLNNHWWIGSTDTGVSCIKNFTPEVSSDFLYKQSVGTSTTAVPETLKRIGVSAFENDVKLERVILEGIQTIDSRAFYGCNLLNEIVIPDTILPVVWEETTDEEGNTIKTLVSGIGKEVFMNCDGLTDLTLNSLNLGDYMFSDCDGLVTVVLPDGLTRTPEGIFKDCDLLKDVTLPESLTIIGKSTFENCKTSFENNLGLKTVKLPEGLTTIEDYAFRSSGIEEIIIPKNVVTIGVETFAHCQNLKNIIYQNACLGDSMLLDCTGLENLTLPEGITDIADLAFADCIKLKTVVLPTTLEHMGKGAFRGCYSLQIMTIPFIGAYSGSLEGEESLFGWIFSVPEVEEQINHMTKITQKGFVDGKLTDVVYYVPTNLQKMVIYNETAIGYGAFSGFTNLVALIIKDNDINVVGDYAFYDCTSLKYVIDVESEYPVKNADGSVTHPVLMNQPINLDYENAFDYDINVYPHVTELGDYAFANCDNIQSVTLPTTLERIGVRAFSNCTILNRINNLDENNQTASDVYDYYLPAALKTIGDYAFENNISVTSIIVPSTTTTMGKAQFGGCKILATLSIPFLGTTNVTMADQTNYTVDAYNIRYNDMSKLFDANEIPSKTFGYLFDTYDYLATPSEEVAVLSAEAATSVPVEQCGITYYLPSTLKTLYITALVGINENALRNCSMIETLVIGDTCQFIDYAALARMAGLKNITMPFVGHNLDAANAYKSFGFLFGPEAFGTGATASLDTYLSDNYYGRYLRAPRIEYIKLTQETHIDYQGFINLTTLKTMILPDTLTAIDSTASGYVAVYGYYPDYRYAYYTNHDSYSASTGGSDAYWGSAVSFAFANCVSLTNLILPESLTAIGRYAFANCDSLTSITIPENVIFYNNGVQDGERAFYDCDGLVEVDFKANWIPDRMFEYCDNLETVKTARWLQHIGGFTFYSNVKLKNIYFDESDKEGIHIAPNVHIGSGAFEYCKSIEMIEINYVDLVANPDPTIVNDYPIIDMFAFYGCSSLKTAIIHGGSIREGVFYGVSSLQNITLDEGVNHIGHQAFREVSPTEITIPSTLDPSADGSASTIGDLIFYNVDSLIKVIYNAQTIGYRMFEESNNIQIVQISSNLKSIRARAFLNVTALCNFNLPEDIDNPIYSIHLPEYVTLCENYATSCSDYASQFYNCDSLVSAFLELETVAQRAFVYCDGLQSVYFTGKYLNNYAFYENNALVTFKVTENFKSTAYQVFYGDGKLAQMYFGDEPFNGVYVPAGTTIGDETFDYCPSLVEFKSECAYIGKEAFYACTGLTKVTLWSGTVGVNAFYGSSYILTGIKEIILGDENEFSEGATGVTAIGNNAFRGTGITTLKFPSSMKEKANFGTYIFYDCNSLTTVDYRSCYVGADMFENCDILTTFKYTEALSAIGYAAFYRCYGLKNFSLDPETTPYVVIPDIVIEVNSSSNAETFRYSGVEKVEINITNIPNYMFSECGSLRSVTIDDATTNIGHYAFSSDAAMEVFNYFAVADANSPDAVLTGLALPMTIETLGNFSLYYFKHSNFSVVDLGDYTALTRIGEAAFGGWNSLQKMRMPFVGSVVGNTTSTWESHFAYIFGNNNPESGCYNCDTSYYSSNYYAPNTLTEIEITRETHIGFGFRGMRNLTKLTLNESITTMENSCLMDCSSLIDITIPFVGTSLGTFDADGNAISGGVNGTFGSMFWNSSDYYYYYNYYNSVSLVSNIM